MFFSKFSACALAILLFNSLIAQTKLSYVASMGGGDVKYFWPYGPLDSQTNLAAQYSMGLRAKTELRTWLHVGSEIGVMRGFSYVNLSMTHTGSSNSIPYTAEIVGMDYNFTYAYLYIFPEFHPLEWKAFYFRAFPVLKLELEDDYVQSDFGGFTGIMTESANGSVNYDYDHYLTRRSHPLLFFLDLGIDYSFSNTPLGWFTEIRCSYLPRSRYFDQKGTSRELDYPDNRFLLLAFNLGLTYEL